LLQFLHHFKAHTLQFSVRFQHTRSSNFPHTYSTRKTKTQYFPSNNQDSHPQKYLQLVVPFINCYLFSPADLHFEQAHKKKSQEVPLVLRRGHSVCPRRQIHKQGSLLSAVIGKQTRSIKRLCLLNGMSYCHDYCIKRILYYNKSNIMYFLYAHPVDKDKWSVWSSVCPYPQVVTRY
jgi:hypothetical protein